MYNHIHIYTDIYIYIYMYIHVYIYIYIYVYTSIHIFLHIHDGPRMYISIGGNSIHLLAAGHWPTNDFFFPEARQSSEILCHCAKYLSPIVALCLRVTVECLLWWLKTDSVHPKDVVFTITFSIERLETRPWLKINASLSEVVAGNPPPGESSSKPESGILRFPDVAGRTPNTSFQQKLHPQENSPWEIEHGGAGMVRSILLGL